LTYGIEKPADLTASHIVLSPQGTHARLNYQGESRDCWWPLVGRFNVYNCLAAIAVMLTQSITLIDIIHRLQYLPKVRGRLQSVPNVLGLTIYVDYAHTDDALTNVLETLHEVKAQCGRLIVVFGCGGDRDRSKRAKMAQAAERWADFCMVTSDNPRSEDSLEICREVIAGFSNKACYEIEIDRKKAIERVLMLAKTEDVILIAGKGHETYQIFADKTTSFDDCEVAQKLCEVIHVIKQNTQACPSSLT
jgi:UDP-N-acetylmuramoyl-L-alanyl-D-glutamate--2,6-diaminopimelate ligase